MAGFLGCLQYVLEEGPRSDWLEDATVATVATVCAACAVVFLWRAFAAAEPVVRLRAFRDRNFALGCGFSLLMGMGLYGAVYLVPLFLARVRGYDALQIGEVMAVTGVFMLLGAPYAGLAARLLDLRAVLALGLAMFGVSIRMTAGLTAESGFWELALPLGLRGFAMMFVMLPINQITLGTLPAEQVKNASGLYNLMRNLGGAMGLAAINTMATERGFLHRLQLAGQVTWDRPGATAYLDTLTNALALRMDRAEAERAALEIVRQMVGSEATVLAYNDILLALGGLFILAVPLVLLLRPVKAEGFGPNH
ncbi:MAG TPA: MFS transporter [Falsiroseomonas sp.]|nr:MFS transporter [Falsiroseomonas sp.]